ncbi:MAG TPA: hypothetical protein VGJ66_20515 [Pyrinomonadaceae bacterium]|jgi:hypothetical protein
MRKIIESTLVSLDGVFGEPHTWAMEYFDQEAEKISISPSSSFPNLASRSNRSLLTKPPLA